MEEVVKVALLGSDFNYIQKVSDKVNNDRPAEVHPFSDLNDFLKFCMSEKPQVVGISVAFPHKSANNFPKIFKMAMNVPSFSFYEKYNFQTDKLLSSSSAEHKIRSPLTAHNLWVRITNILKEDEKKQDGQTYNGQDGESKKENDSIHLKGESSKKLEEQTSLNSILKALDQGDTDLDNKTSSTNQEIGSKKSSSIENNPNKNQSKIKSTDNDNDAEIKGTSINDTDDGGVKIDSRDVRSIKKIDTDSSSKAPSEFNSSESTEEESVGKEKSLKHSEEDKENKASMLNTSQKHDEKQNEKTKNQIGSSSGWDRNSSQEKQGSSEGTKNSKKGSQKDLERELTKKKNSVEQAKGNENKGLGSLLADIEDSSNKKKGELKENTNDQVNRNSEPKPFIPSELKKPQQSKDKSNPNSKESKNENTQKNKEFGAVKLSDKEQMKKEDRQKKKEKDRRENQKKLNILKSSSELGLQTAYLSESTENYQPFSVNFLSTFIVESGAFKGILVLATTAELGTEDLIDDFRITVIENLKKNNIQCEVSKEYPISMEIDKYQDVVKMFAEFSINFSDRDGNQQNVFFVTRESVRPSFQDSVLPDMYEVDIKVIPPQTPVNFDAYVHLPRNKKFVRYLKEGRSLSLKQAKRHSEEEQNTLYLPKDQKDRFIAFFIKNTLNWDFTLHNKRIRKEAA